MDSRLDWIDTHCHLTYGQLAQDPDGAWTRAQDSGVGRAVLVGIDLNSSRRLIPFVRERPGLYATVGLHPSSTHEPGGDPDHVAEALHELASSKEVVAVGETGLDLYWKKSPLATQLDWLDRHAEIALAHDLPLVLHLRDAFPEARRAMQPWADRGIRAVVHCFTGGPEDLSPFVEWGFWISFSGVLTYRSAAPVREAARKVPLEQCVLETDAPWLAPEPHRGQTNEPAHLVHTARCFAELRDVELAELAAITTANARRLFRLPD